MESSDWLTVLLKIRMLRFQLQRLGEFFFRAGEIALRLQRLAPLRIRLTPFRVERNGLLVFRDGTDVITIGREHFSPIVLRVTELRAERYRFFELLLGTLCIALCGQRTSETYMPYGTVR